MKKKGKFLLVKGAVIVVEKEGELPYEINANTFFKRYSKTYPDSGPEAIVAFAGQEIAEIAELVDLEFNKQKKETKLRFRIAKDDRAGLDAFDPSSGACAVEFFTPCNSPPPTPLRCSYSDTACAVGSICPAGTVVSAECADRSAFGESPCACTALQQLVRLSLTRVNPWDSGAYLQAQAPWVDLENAAYCQSESDLSVYCEPVDGVQLPTYVSGGLVRLDGGLPRSLGDLGPSLTALALYGNSAAGAAMSLPTEIGTLTGLEDLYLRGNDISSLPTEIGALSSLTRLDLFGNRLTGFPTEFRTVNPSNACDLGSNDLLYGGGDPLGGCANVGSGTSCCTADNCPRGTSECYQG